MFIDDACFYDWILRRVLGSPSVYDGAQKAAGSLLHSNFNAVAQQNTFYIWIYKEIHTIIDLHSMFYFSPQSLPHFV